MMFEKWFREKFSINNMGSANMERLRRDLKVKTAQLAVLKEDEAKKLKES